MKDIVIYGAGGLGREVACLINAINDVNLQWNLVGFIDDGLSVGTQVSHYGKVLGGKNFLLSKNKPISVVISIGSPKVVKQIVEELSKNSFILFPNLVYPSLRFADRETFKIGVGNVIKHDCGFSCDIKIGNFNLLNGGVVFGHDVEIGDFNTFMPDVRISGEVKIGCGNFLGVGSIVLQQVIIDENVRLGAASVMIRKPKNGELYIGNPAKIVKL